MCLCLCVCLGVYMSMSVSACDRVCACVSFRACVRAFVYSSWRV